MKNKSWLLGCIPLGAFYFLLIPACFKKSVNAAVINNFGDSITSIKTFRKMHTLGMAEYIAQPIFIQGTVVANDEHDNIYKSIIIQDSTGGIVLLLDGTNLYQNYPLGAFVRVRLKNLFLTELYNYLPLNRSCPL